MSISGGGAYQWFRPGAGPPCKRRVQKAYECPVCIVNPSTAWRHCRACRHMGPSPKSKYYLQRYIELYMYMAMYYIAIIVDPLMFNSIWILTLSGVYLTGVVFFKFTCVLVNRWQLEYSPIQEKYNIHESPPPPTPPTPPTRTPHLPPAPPPRPGLPTVNIGLHFK